MAKKVLFFLILLAAIILVVAFFKQDKPVDQYRLFMQQNKPWQEYSGTTSAIYLKDSHVMILYDQDEDRYWLADLNDFYDVLYRDALKCSDPSRNPPCSPIEELKGVYTVYGATFSVTDNQLLVTFADSETIQSSQPITYELESTLDGKNIKLTGGN